jgi:hypothetical protein
MTVSVNGTTGITFNDASIQNTAASGFGFKNRIINGAMVIDQRNAGASVTQIVAGVYGVDRWFTFGQVTSKFTFQQVTDAPSDFKNSTKITSLSSYTVGASELYQFTQNIEGLNVYDLGWGTASAKTVTLSFWVKSSLTGTFGVFLGNSAANRLYPASYTINVANTWEQKSITIAGDTTGTWLTDNGVGIRLGFVMGAGSTFSGTANAWNAGTAFSPTGATSVVGTNGATFYITGVQLEKGSTATSFDYRPYGTELALCQRYYWKTTGADGLAGVGSGYIVSATAAAVVIPMNVNMRVSPTIAYGGVVYVQDGGGAAVTSILNNYGGRQSCFVQFGASGLSAGRGLTCFTNSTSSDFVSGSAEL